MLEKIKSVFSESISKEEYICIRPMVEKQNTYMLQWASVVTALLMLILVALSLNSFFSLIRMNMPVYLAGGIVSSIVFCLAKFILPERSRLLKPLFYCFLFIIVLFSIHIGVYTNEEQRASTICLILFAIPLLIIDKPWRIMLFLFLSTVLFCTVAFHFKTHEIFILDAVNCSCIFFVSSAVNFAQQRMKFRTIKDRYILDQYNSRLIASQEKELQESRISIMLSQIQPHFLYNALSVISYLCEKNPNEAQTAINNFSDYLRGNLDSLKQTEPIAFENELEHVKVYLSLEKMRFGDELNIAYDIQTTDFLIPTLTVQPLVENAVRYGVLKKGGGGGTVTIATRKYENRYEVIVSDNGMGYDPNAVQIDGRTHIGIENVRSRLASMVGGSLEIESKKGVGTTATITLPKERR